MGLVGGAMVPRIAMPALMQLIGLATPHAWAPDAYHGVLVRAEPGLYDIALSIAALAGFASPGALRFRFER